jgi:hypothetical protein
MATDKEMLFDCVISAGELDPNWYGHYLDNEMYTHEIVKHNVTEQEAKEWWSSNERMQKVRELENNAKEKLSEERWYRYKVSYYYTKASND